MQTSGLGNTNAGQRQTVGLTREFHTRILDHYVLRAGLPERLPFRAACCGRVYEAWLTEAGVRVLKEEGGGAGR